jgi:hypothetical protein
MTRSLNPPTDLSTLNKKIFVFLSCSIFCELGMKTKKLLATITKSLTLHLCRKSCRFLTYSFSHCLILQIRYELIYQALATADVEEKPERLTGVSFRRSIRKVFFFREEISIAAQKHNKSLNHRANKSIKLSRARKFLFILRIESKHPRKVGREREKTKNISSS